MEEKRDALVVVESNGHIFWMPQAILRSSCGFETTYFPFDEQNCSMTFASWTHDGLQVNLSLTTTEGDISNYIKNSEWSLQKLC